VILPDVNVLIYSFRADSPHHDLCRRWFEAAIADEPRFGVSPLALAALVRVTTQAKFMHSPSRLDEAFRFCDYLLDQPHCQLVEPGERHWTIFQRLCVETNTRGPLVSDAWYAALAIEWGCEWITLDRDFAHFPGLKWRAPTL
jgi:uncharacterized protein